MQCWHSKSKLPPNLSCSHGLQYREDCGWCRACCTHQDVPQTRIGWLEYTSQGDLVLGCETCAVRRETPVYRINVYPYRGTCDKCGVTLVEPQTPAWPELFGRGTFDSREDKAGGAQ